MRNIKVETQQGIDVAALLAWQDRCAKYTQTFGTAIAYARNEMLRRLPRHDQTGAAAVRELIELLEEVRRPLLLLRCVTLRPGDPLERLFNYQKHCIRVGIWATAALCVYDDDQEALKGFARWVLRDGAQWPNLARALVENHLKGWKDWRHADNPESWIGRVARNLALAEAKEEAPEPDTIALDKIVGTPAESLDYGIGTDLVFDDGAREALEEDLKKYAEVDPDLAVYGTLRLRGMKHKAIHAQFGWSKSHAYNVQARYLRWESKRAPGILAKYQKFKTQTRGSDASRTMDYEILAGGTLGRAAPRSGKHRSGGGLGVWQHRKPERTP